MRTDSDAESVGTLCHGCHSRIVIPSLFLKQPTCAFFPLAAPLLEEKGYMLTFARNMQLLDELLAHLNGNTLVCLAANLSTSTEFIKTMSCAEWKKNKPDLNKIPCVFGIGH